MLARWRSVNTPEDKSQPTRLGKFSLKFSTSLTILVPFFWILIISFVFFYLSTVSFSGFFQIKENLVWVQYNSKCQAFNLKGHHTLIFKKHIYIYGLVAEELRIRVLESFNCNWLLKQQSIQWNDRVIHVGYFTSWTKAIQQRCVATLGINHKIAWKYINFT